MSESIMTAASAVGSVMDAWTVGPWSVGTWGVVLLSAVGATFVLLVGTEWARRRGVAKWARRGERVALLCGGMAVLGTLPVMRGVERVRRWEAATSAMAAVSYRMTIDWVARGDSAWATVAPPEDVGTLALRAFHASRDGYEFTYVARRDSTLVCVAALPRGGASCRAPWFRAGPLVVWQAPPLLPPAMRGRIATEPPDAPRVSAGGTR